jgi:alkylation response protein AidB-like acyl-CoA dehydrogenase
MAEVDLISERALRAQAREFVDQVLLPLEEKAELAGGPLPEEDIRTIREAALAAGLQGGRHLREHGGNSWTTRQWFLVEEQFGRATNGLSWYVPNAYNVWKMGSPEQIDRWLRPALRGELHDAYAVTEEFAGSDPTAMATTATRVGPGRWLLSGEKWFVTFGTVASILVVMAWAVEEPGGERRPTLFAVPADAPGIELVDDPPFTHTFGHGHPTMRFTDVELTDADLLGAVGQGDELQRKWFVEERLAIAARCVGAMERVLAESLTWAAGREQGGGRLLDHQGISFPLADSATDTAAGRLLALDVAQRFDEGEDPKLVHAKAAMAKLFCSEAAGRCADRGVQILGGRGYLRTNPVERMWRELRVERIWEGTSEIQRLIVARGLERRGLLEMLS